MNCGLWNERECINYLHWFSEWPLCQQFTRQTQLPNRFNGIRLFCSFFIVKWQQWHQRQHLQLSSTIRNSKLNCVRFSTLLLPFIFLFSLSFSFAGQMSRRCFRMPTKLIFIQCFHLNESKYRKLIHIQYASGCMHEYPTINIELSRKLHQWTNSINNFVVRTCKRSRLPFNWHVPALLA